MKLQLTVPRKNDGVYKQKLFDKPYGCSLNKPEKGGLWSSTYDKTYGSDWIRWCNDNDFGYPKHGTLLIPNEDARIFVINSCEDALNLLQSFMIDREDRYSLLGMYAYASFDYGALSEFFDAIHLTIKGESSTRHAEPSLYGWDSESVLWLNTAFTVKKIIKTKKYLKNYQEFQFSML